MKEEPIMVTPEQMFRIQIAIGGYHKLVSQSDDGKEFTFNVNHIILTFKLI